MQAILAYVWALKFLYDRKDENDSETTVTRCHKQKNAIKNRLFF